ncbi:hypothetical protein SO802_030105, partial [Lithocarpus litseifolius]
IISLWFPKASLACDILRNCYEAFALYTFGSYLIACLGGESRVIELLENKSQKQLGEPLLEGEDENHTVQERSFSNFFFRPCTLGKDLLAIEKFGLVQYMILKTVCAYLALLLELFGVYGDGEFKRNYGHVSYMQVQHLYIQMWALYCLVKFYNVTHERLQSIKPLAKFISFKAFVFATWWQGVGIALLHTIGVLPKEGKLQTGLQDFLICIEVSCFCCFSEYGKVTTKTTKEALKLEEGDKEKSAVLEKTETNVEALGTSVTESVQDIVVEGGQHVVQDVVLTINQAIGPVEKGVTKIQETFYHKSEVKDLDDQEEKVEPKVEQHVEENHSESETHVNSGRDVDT